MVGVQSVDSVPVQGGSKTVGMAVSIGKQVYRYWNSDRPDFFRSTAANRSKRRVGFWVKDVSASGDTKIEVRRKVRQSFEGLKKREQHLVRVHEQTIVVDWFWKLAHELTNMTSSFLRR